MLKLYSINDIQDGREIIITCVRTSRDFYLAHSGLNLGILPTLLPGSSSLLLQHSPQACSPWSGLPVRDSPGWDYVLFIDLA